MRLISAIISRGHMRFGQTQKRGVNATLHRATAAPRPFWRGSFPTTAKVKPYSMKRSKRLNI
jgi:hypothetical protein